jgi:hypothetical protein
MIVSKSKGLEPAMPEIRVMIIVNHHDYNGISWKIPMDNHVATSLSATSLE